VTTRLRAYLVDDEPLALERLHRLLDLTGRVEVTGATTDPEEAAAALTAAPPDLCFLDIQMPRLNGFELLGRLARPPQVVFTTAYDRYALQAFGVSAADYLLKPIELGPLNNALTKVERLRDAGALAPVDIQALVRQLTEALRSAKPEYPSRIGSRLGERILFLDLARVTHFQAEDRLTFAVSDGKAYCVDHGIGLLEGMLDPKSWIRIHRGSLVNVQWIRDVAPLPGGSLCLRLKDTANTELTVARDRAREFKARMAGLPAPRRA
jgi:two-component system, LytTR family, response regulator